MSKEEILRKITEEYTDYSEPEYPVKDVRLSPEKLAEFLAELLKSK